MATGTEVAEAEAAVVEEEEEEAMVGAAAMDDDNDDDSDDDDRDGGRVSCMPPLPPPRPNAAATAPPELGCPCRAFSTRAWRADWRSPTEVALSKVGLAGMEEVDGAVKYPDQSMACLSEALITECTQHTPF